MKKVKKILISALALALFAVSFLTMAACGPKEDVIDPDDDKKPGTTHTCESKCPDCGGCLDMECTESACLTKCGDSYAYGVTYTVAEDLYIAKSGLTYDKTKGYYTGFNKANEGALAFTFTADRDATVNLTAYVYKTTEADVFTDVIETKVNGEAVSRSSVIRAGSASEIATVNLGCVDVKGDQENTITFVAEGDGAHAHEFTAIQLAYAEEGAQFALRPAIEVEHTCKSVCAECGGCTNFSCLNPGCAGKCSCVSGTENAAIFTVLDDRADNHGRGINSERDGVGCTWNQETRITYVIDSSIAGSVKLGAVVSADSLENILFTDQFVLTVNGERATCAGVMPVSESGQREWNTYSMIVVGDITLKKGANVIDFSQTPRKDGTNCAYNFQSMILFSDTGEFDWSETEAHTMEYTPAKAATCTQAGNVAYYYCSDCEKYFSDEAGNTELNASELTVPVDPNNHDEIIGEDDVSVTCSRCSAAVGYNFYGVDDRCVFTGLDKNAEENFLPGKNGTNTTITYYIVSDKDASVSMYVDCSAVATHWQVEFNKTWTVAVTDAEGTETPYTSDTIHHNENGKPDSVGDVDRYHYFAQEYVCDVQLKAGVNKVVFTGTGKEQLNFRALLFKNTNGAVLSWGTAPAETETYTMEYVPAKAATCTQVGNVAYYYCSDCEKYFSDEAGNTELNATELTVPVDPNNHDEIIGEDDVSVTCSRCSAVIGYNFYGVDDRCVFTGLDKNAEENFLPGKNGTNTTITYYIVSDKDASVSMYVDCSAIATKWEVEFNKTWTVAVTDAEGTETPYTSDTIHHNENGKPDSVGDVDRYHYFAQEYVCDVQLKAGVNKVVFTGTGKEQLNFRALLFKNTNGAVLSWGTAPAEEA